MIKLLKTLRKDTMENEFLKRINLLYNELIFANRLKFDGQNYYVKNRQTNKWAIAKVHKGDTISAPTSRGTSCPLSNVRFMLANPGPYTIEGLVRLAFEGELHKHFKWIQGFWTTETRKLYFDLLKERNIPLFEHYIKVHHTAFYKSIRKSYNGKQKYRKFILDMGEDPDKISGLKNLSAFLNDGRHIEMVIVNLLREIRAPFDYGRRFDNKFIPDLYNYLTDEAIDLKRHINTGIVKEIDNYTTYFSKVTVIYLLGSRSKESNISGIRKVSIFKWIQEQDFFTRLNIHKQTEILDSLERLVEKVNLKQAAQDRMDYHRKLVNRIIELDKAGLTNPQIAEQVGVTYKYVHSILIGKSLKEYSGNYPVTYKKRQALNRDFKSNKTPQIIKSLTTEGVGVKEIAEQLRISTDMVKYHLRNQGLNEKNTLRIRNERLMELFMMDTKHNNLTEKFKWIVMELKEEYPQLKFGAVKNFYYTKYKSPGMSKE